MKLNYYNLLIDWNNDGNFSPEFGAFDKSTVIQERKDEYPNETSKIEVTFEDIVPESFKEAK